MLQNGVNQLDIEYGNTARLEGGSGRSSTLSLGRGRDVASDDNDDAVVNIHSHRAPPNNTSTYNTKQLNGGGKIKG